MAKPVDTDSLVPEGLLDELMEGGEAPEEPEAPEVEAEAPETAEDEQPEEADSAPQETAEAPSEPEAPEGSEPWTVKAVVAERRKRQEAEAKFAEQQKALEALQAQMRALYGNKPPEQAQQKPEDDFDSFLKSLVGEDSDSYEEQPSVNPRIAQELHELRKQNQQLQQWAQQQTVAQQQQFIRERVASIREDHPMVPERVLINAIAQGIDPVEVALEARQTFEEHYGKQAPTPAKKAPPKPLSTPPKGKGAKAKPKNKPAKRGRPEWAGGKGKIPSIADDILEALGNGLE